MIFSLLQFGNLPPDVDIYSNNKPLSSKHVKFCGKDAYTMYHSHDWTPEEFLFLKQYAYYHLSAPCYNFAKKEKVLLSLERISKRENFLYVIAYLFNKYRIDVF